MKNNAFNQTALKATYAISAARSAVPGKACIAT